VGIEECGRDVGEPLEPGEDEANERDRIEHLFRFLGIFLVLRDRAVAPAFHL